jgi:hypothetical protein
MLPNLSSLRAPSRGPSHALPLPPAVDGFFSGGRDSESAACLRVDSKNGFVVDGGIINMLDNSAHLIGIINETLRETLTGQRCIRPGHLDSALVVRKIDFRPGESLLSAGAYNKVLVTITFGNVRAFVKEVAEAKVDGKFEPWKKWVGERLPKFFSGAVGSGAQRLAGYDEFTLETVVTLNIAKNDDGIGDGIRIDLDEFGLVRKNKDSDYKQLLETFKKFITFLGLLPLTVPKEKITGGMWK